MRNSANNLRCEEFQSNLPYIIGSGETIAEHSHLQSCALCRSLLADLNVIAQAARQLFPIQDPPAALWGHIESAIVKQEALHKH
jgi:hypothetical protein